ncbi:hypothetical protein BZA05DRAFT_184433 [Tricharina praecox]|uniref:uncharacterized protein n=1 Tax=Tricharina praecox TaxID=43433 RepID=UPI00221F34B4|nr:uncharacterized protein BZA05DRAFT_184433 [Tricharina praecox]KAI5843246.1 hypothetical protein BZA05DRAFT_184433 [Tricharina praecox]
MCVYPCICISNSKHSTFAAAANCMAGPKPRIPLMIHTPICPNHAHPSHPPHTLQTTSPFFPSFQGCGDISLTCVPRCRARYVGVDHPSIHSERSTGSSRSSSGGRMVKQNGTHLFCGPYIKRMGWCEMKQQPASFGAPLPTPLAKANVCRSFAMPNPPPPPPPLPQPFRTTERREGKVQFVDRTQHFPSCHAMPG